MKNYFAKSSVALMVVSAALASCTQEEIVQNDLPTRQTLNISVNTQDFVSEDGSRATTDAGRTTVFAEGDAMGVYVISSDETVICNNEKFVYDGNAWKAENELYYWKNANYIAYYPYNADLTAQNITKVEEIKTKFAEPADFYTQNTAEAYEKADLMLDTIQKPTDGELEFNLAHQFSMVEINVPVRRYKTTEAQGSFEYTAPVSLEWESPLKIGEQTVTPYSAGKGSFRFIVPSDTNLSLTLDGRLMYDEGIPVYFGSSTQTQSINLASGTCKVYNVTYNSEVESGVVTRDLEVGDYYYSDGSIYPYGNQEGDKDKSKPVKNGCIGVIFEVGTGAPGTDWTHGSVLALTNAWPDWSEWGGASEPIEGNNTSGFIDDTEKRNFLMSKMDGYKMSDYFTKGAMSRVKVYGTEDSYPDYKAPQTSSGWYLPSTGQLVSLMKGLGKYEFTVDNLESVDAQYREGKSKALSNIENAIVKVKGVFWDNDGDSETFQRWWTTTEHDNLNVWAIEWKRDGQIKLLTRNKTQGWNQVKSYARPVLSF